MFQVTFFIGKSKHTKIGYSPYYKTEEDCDNFIESMKKLPNSNNFSCFATFEIELVNFSEKDIDEFK